jgi:hypothetical protein
MTLAAAASLTLKYSDRSPQGPEGDPEAELYPSRAAPLEQRRQTRVGRSEAERQVLHQLNTLTPASTEIPRVTGNSHCIDRLNRQPSGIRLKPGLSGNHPLQEAYNASMATTSYLDRLLDPLTEAFTPKMASALLELRADCEVEAHIGELRRKANHGTLTPAEDAEYKDFVEAVDLISIMQAKARRFLAKQSA